MREQNVNSCGSPEVEYSLTTDSYLLLRSLRAVGKKEFFSLVVFFLRVEVQTDHAGGGWGP